MSIIVASPKEKLLMADDFVFNGTGQSAHIPKLGKVFEQKIIISPDNYFAYVFDCQQNDAAAQLALNYIYRWESGETKERENPFKEGMKDFSMTVMTKRGFYNANPDNLVAVSEWSNMWSNVLKNESLFELADLTAREVFDIFLLHGDYRARSVPTVVKQSSLKLIQRKKK